MHFEGSQLQVFMIGILHFQKEALVDQFRQKAGALTSISARDIVTWGRRCLTEMSELLTKTKQLDNHISEQQSQIDKITA